MLAESITRLEDAARTQAEFENVIELWDQHFSLHHTLFRL